jgi:hypothetical protein
MILWFLHPKKSISFVALSEKISICLSINSSGAYVFLRSQTSMPPYPAENKYFPFFENSRALISPL